MANFIRHTSCEKCGSSDANALYDDGSTYCFSCNTVVGSTTGTVKTVKEKKILTDKELKIMTEQTKQALDMEEYEEIKAITTTKPSGFRGIRDDVSSYFGVRYLVENESVVKQYCPITEEGSLVGLKIREIPKIFSTVGRVGKKSDLFLQFRYTKGGKYLVITEGEIDALSAYQMLNDYNKSKGSPFETAVVSAVIGANSANQIKYNYKFIDQFDQIILCYDNDETGQSAIEDVVKSLPKGKVKIMKMRYKDANEYLKKEADKEFVQDFYNAETYVPVGVLGSSQLYNKILEQADIAKVLFPPFMKKLNDKLVGGMPLGHIINIGAKTGIGKTTIVNEMVYYWVMNSPHKAGVVSMELDSGQYGEVLLSRHLSSKLALMKSQSDKNAFLSNETIKKRALELFTDEQGNDRFFVLDNRDGSIDEIKNTIEELIISCGCRIIILDPLQDILAGLAVDEQELFMKWVKGSIKSHGVTFILINHMRKSQGAAHDVDEEDFQGSSTIIKSASVNIILSRDKASDDDVERNTTRITVTKNRITGLTGPAGEVYYDNESHTLYDSDEFFTNGTPHKH